MRRQDKDATPKESNNKKKKKIKNLLDINDCWPASWRVKQSSFPIARLVSFYSHPRCSAFSSMEPETSFYTRNSTAHESKWSEREKEGRKYVEHKTWPLLPDLQRLSLVEFTFPLIIVWYATQLIQNHQNEHKNLGIYFCFSSMRTFRLPKHSMTRSCI